MTLSGDGGQELIEHPCAHWVVKRLIAIDSKRREEEEDGDGSKGKFVWQCGALQGKAGWALGCYTV